MRIVLFHTYYLQTGGEDQIFATEIALLRSNGHEVTSFTLNNRDLTDMRFWRQAMVTLWNGQVYCNLRALIRKVRPDIIHVHNTFPSASPAVVHAARAEGVPVVMTLHNYRLLCPAATFFRNGRVCEDCLARFVPWPGVLHGCWRGRAPTGVVAAMLTVHRRLGTWEKVDIYIALTEFARQKFIEGRLPPDKIVVKPNFVAPDPGVGTHVGDYALFVGRLSPEKGLRTLIQAWRLLERVPLKIVGDGPLRGEIEWTVQRENLRGIELMGRRSQEEVFRLMHNARILVFPSEWYEGFPRTIAEALACGLPVVASRLGAMAEIIEERRTGLLFTPGDPEDLAEKIVWAWSHPHALAEMGRAARHEYETKYTAERNYEQLMAIYDMAIAQARARR